MSWRRRWFPNGEWVLLLALAAEVLFFSAIAPGFFTLQNQTDLLLTNMPVLIVALGMTLVILAGQIDISVGSVFAICSVAAGEFAKMGLPTPVAAVAACGPGRADSAHSTAHWWLTCGSRPSW
jgi:rhamnose transport system permease protein